MRCHAVRTHVGSLVVDKDTKFAVVVARFNDLVTKLLLEGAVEALKRHGATESNIEVCTTGVCTHVLTILITQVVWVPGSFELPLVAKSMAQSDKFGAVITLGAVVGNGWWCTHCLMTHPCDTRFGAPLHTTMRWCLALRRACLVLAPILVFP